MSKIADADITKLRTLVADPKSREEPARALQVSKDLVGSALEEAGFGAFKTRLLLVTPTEFQIPEFRNSYSWCDSRAVPGDLRLVR